MAEMLENLNDIVITGSSLESAERAVEGTGWEAATNIDAVKDADVVIVSAPIHLTEDVIHDIGPHVQDDALLCDVTSVKERPCEAMEQYSSEVLGMHPMYAPSNSAEGQQVVLCPVKGKKWTMMEEFWMEHDANVFIATPEEHDSAMSVVQGLIHFSELVIAETLNSMDTDHEDTEQYSTPIHRIVTDLTARMLNQQSELYHSIQTENPRNDEMREKFQEAAESMAELIGSDDFDDKFTELGEQFDLESSQEHSDDLIEFMTRRN
jgi:prephenate dehydrogenase